MRIYELARKYDMTSKEVVAVCHRLNIVAKAAQSTVKGEDLDTITTFLEAGKDSAVAMVTVENHSAVNVVLAKKENVVYVSTECQPFIEIGELGYTTTQAVEALKLKNVNVNVFLPYSVQLEGLHDRLTNCLTVNIDINEEVRQATIYKLEQDDVNYYFVQEADYFTRAQMYGYEDDVKRFAFYSHAVLQALPKVCETVKTLYVNEWHTSFIPLLMHTTYQTAFYQEIQTVLTVHSLEYQGWFEPHVLKTAIGISQDYYENGLMRMGSCVNILKSGIETAKSVMLTQTAQAQLDQDDMITCGITSVLQHKIIN